MTEPKFIEKISQPPYTYEIYQADSAESARSFLETKTVTEPNYYVKVDTPEGTWGVDIDGLYTERLAPFQLDIASAECEGRVCGMPSVASLQYAANGVTDNLVVHIECGKCKHQWQDGVRFKDVVVVRCPGCKALNKVDTSPHIGEIAGMLQFNVSMG